MRFDEILEGLKQLHESKMHDYSDGDDPYSNYTHAAKAIGVTTEDYIFSRITEKCHRIASLKKQNKDPKHESLIDSYRDIACMCVIAMEILNANN